MSDRPRERDAVAPVRPARPRETPSQSVASLIEGMGCEPAEACLDGEAPLRREASEP